MQSSRIVMLRLLIALQTVCFLALVAPAAMAQSAYSYDGYSSDGVNISTWVVISGDMTGGIYNHSYHAYNALGSAGGPMSAGPTTSAATLRNDQVQPAAAGVEYLWSRDTWAYCDFVGPSTPFFQSGWSTGVIGLAKTYSETVADSGTGLCTVWANCNPYIAPACPAGPAPYSFTINESGGPCHPFHVSLFVTYRSDWGQPRSCFPAGISLPVGPGGGVCTPR